MRPSPYSKGCHCSFSVEQCQIAVGNECCLCPMLQTDSSNTTEFSTRALECTCKQSRSWSRSAARSVLSMYTCKNVSAAESLCNADRASTTCSYDSEQQHCHKASFQHAPYKHVSALRTQPEHQQCTNTIWPKCERCSRCKPDFVLCSGAAEASIISPQCGFIMLSHVS